MNYAKLRKLLSDHKPGTVSLASWLESLGISTDLLKRYRKSGWFESIGTGAFIRPGDHVSWIGGLYALQQQAKLPVHVGANTALEIHGVSHYIRTKLIVYLFSPLSTPLPRWFLAYKWENEIQHVKTSMLPREVGLTTHQEQNIPFTVSTSERAILECLYLAPKKMDLVECYHLMEGLSNLRPKVLQELLEKCSSVKVKRLFLFMATKAQHQWLSFIDQKKIDLGKGDRSIVDHGVYNAAFHITIPKELAS